MLQLINGKKNYTYHNITWCVYEYFKNVILPFSFKCYSKIKQSTKQFNKLSKRVDFN